MARSIVKRRWLLLGSPVTAISLTLFTLSYGSCRIVPCQQLVSCENHPFSSLCPSDGELIVCEVKIRHWNDNKNATENLDCEDRTISAHWIAFLLTVRTMWCTSNIRHPHVSFCLVIIQKIPRFISEPNERESNGSHRTLLVCLLLEAVIQSQIFDWFFWLTIGFSRSYSTGQSLKVLAVGCCFWCFYMPKSFSVLSSHSTKRYAIAAKSKGQWSTV